MQHFFRKAQFDIWLGPSNFSCWIWPTSLGGYYHRWSKFISREAYPNHIVSPALRIWHRILLMFVLSKAEQHKANSTNLLPFTPLSTLPSVGWLIMFGYLPPTGWQWCHLGVFKKTDLHSKWSVIVWKKILCCESGHGPQKGI